MSVERPTFSESWYRVAELRPRLRCTAQIHRQHFRGQTWYVVQDEASNRFFRLNDTAYRFVGMLDGRRTVADTWQVCNEELGDSAPTQGEIIHLLGQLYTSNLLYAELPADTEGMFRRYRKRVTREVTGYLSSLLFARIPLLDPDRFLGRWVGVFGKVFSWLGVALWLVLLATGLYFLAGRGGALVAGASGLLDTDNILLLYACFAVVKVLHEFAHGFACKKYGQQGGTGGEVHAMGIMLLVFTPVPYVDASSSWAFRSKWQRAMVAAAGMMVELAVASVAAIVWANTSEGTVPHAIAYNVIFVASVSTLLFNGNPLLRYDGYYILSDLLEIANLAPSSRQYMYYLVKRYAWGVRQVHGPAHTSGERVWMITYAVASTIYRVFVCVAILLFVADKLFVVGAILAIAAVATWVILPVGRLLYYLFADGELARSRVRAVATTCGALGVSAVCVGLIPLPDHARAEGIVEADRMAIVHAAADGFVEAVLPTETHVRPDGPPLVAASNPELLSHRAELVAEHRRLEIRRRLALREEDIAVVQVCAEQITALDEQIRHDEEQIALLALHAPFPGTWVAPDIDRALGAYHRRGDKLGLVASLDNVIVRATAKQEIAALLFTEADARVEIRAKDRPDTLLAGTIRQIFPAGEKQLPSAALGFGVGGSMEVVPDDRSGTKAIEPFFEIRIALDRGMSLFPGQRVIVRFDMRTKPLAMQWWRTISQLIQRRFHI